MSRWLGSSERLRGSANPGTQRSLGATTVGTEGFNLHAGVRVAARRRRQLERLCSYVLRPPVDQERLELPADGRVAYHLKQPWSDGTTAVARHIIAAITQTTVIRAILRACGLPAAPPALAHPAPATCRPSGCP
ncbi:MAG: hypothetical protein EOO40_02980 [Deltaproteobacteria bacterium]|nr:MAG: hypothetical protein EOO40_02980 [Deltaproteobacteria bacterium]